MLYSDRFRAAEQRLLHKTQTDAQGILRWKSNGLVVPPGIAELAAKYDLTPQEAAAHKAAWALQDAAIWARYRAMCAPACLAA